MIPPQQAVDIALEAATGNNDGTETFVIVTDRAEASLRWANNTMTTNGEAISRSVTVISALFDDEGPRVGSVTAEQADPARLPEIVAAAAEAAADAPAAGDAADLLTGTAAPPDWDEPAPGTDVAAFASLTAPLTKGFTNTGADRLFGFARHEVATTFLASTTGIRRRFTQPTGTVEINAKRGSNNSASAWAGAATRDFTDVNADALLTELDTRLGWAQRTVDLPAGRYETLMPPSTVADMMIYLGWSLSGRGAQEGRTALAAPGGGTRVGEKLTDLGLTLYSDPGAPALGCAPFVAASSSSELTSVFDNGMDITRTDWIRDGTINALVYPRAAAREFGEAPAVAADNLLMTGGERSLDEMVAATERGLLLTTLWYIREVDPTTLLLTGLTRDGVYLIEDGAVTAAVNNFRFNESPLGLLRRASEAGVAQRILPREWSDWATRASMPSLRIPDFHMSSVSQAQ